MGVGEMTTTEEGSAYCFQCQRVTEHLIVRHPNETYYWCQVCGSSAVSRHPQVSEKQNLPIKNKGEH